VATTVAPARAARRPRTPTGLHPDACHPATGRLAPTPTQTRPRGRAYAQAPIGPAAHPARHTRPRVRGRTVATDVGEPPPPPNRECAARPQRLPPPGRLRLRGPVRGRDRPIGFHNPRISPGWFGSRVGGMSHISAPNWQLATSSPLDGPKPMYCGNWPVARPLGGYFRLFIFYCLFACLFYLSAGTHYDRL